MDDRAETQRIEERLPQGTDERLARPWLSTRGAITPVAILQPLSSPVGDVVMYTSSVAGHNLRMSLGSSVAEARSHKTSAGSTSGKQGRDEEAKAPPKAEPEGGGEADALAARRRMLIRQTSSNLSTVMQASSRELMACGECDRVVSGIVLLEYMVSSEDLSRGLDPRLH
ncbi:hypothetical protein EMIHUDRAFT_251354 [Emiliania huxleyi CCMP1516]|uniref:Uncharacterized protein n=2 Tax=Emiliania huxleyi TaxID=2903 RepID=A0A0D3KVX5_EMIH1|nr:hypothetical protein EMIHUDRAFT_251354 [Emiliania huxleyi CCMP1516]EOD39910.1 hypothetical protein EMIHUDRAFT_251354 [Emiliania huxleyi CCMP1516]|eukprot:XP_005792339.1 hypothetical protein EMIHUDRAFT_251354 [Emiliania huxleyi CCMP1516]